MDLTLIFLPILIANIHTSCVVISFDPLAHSCICSEDFVSIFSIYLPMILKSVVLSHPTLVLQKQKKKEQKGRLECATQCTIYVKSTECIEIPIIQLDI